MMQKISLQKLSESIKPLCPRDRHVMRYDAKGIPTLGEADDDGAAPCYRCDFEGCTVRYTPVDGYFTVVEMPDLAQAVDEPGVNLLRCLRHEAWLYRAISEAPGEDLVWHCGVEGCDYLRANFGPAWPSL